MTTCSNQYQAAQLLTEQANERDQKRLEKASGDNEWVSASVLR